MSNSKQPSKTVDVVILGAGTAGQNAYKQVRKHTDSVLIVNAGYWTTTCATVGCMPSKLLIAAAERAHHANHSDAFGVLGEATIDGKQVMRRVQDERDRFAGFVQDSVDEWDESHKIDGYAHINEHGLIDVYANQTGFATNESSIAVIDAKYVIVATGTTPFIPDGWKEHLGDALLTSDTVFEITDLPNSLAVVGAGAIGLELAQAMHRLGVDVTLFNRSTRLGGLQDDAVNQKAIACLGAELTLKLDSNIKRVGKTDGHAFIDYQDSEGNEQKWQGDTVLVAAGRRAYLKELGIEHLGVELDDKGNPKHRDKITGQISTADRALPVFVVGDADGVLPLLHVASNEGSRAGQAVGNLMAEQSACADINAPKTQMSVVFSEPQIASVGHALQDIEEANIEHVIGEVTFDNQGRSRVMGVNCGLLRIYVQKNSGQVLGASMVAPDAEYIAHILATAITNGLTVADLLASPFYHPTILEGLRTALRDAQKKVPTPCRENFINDC